MGYFIALDAGGTNTRCWVAHDTQVLGTAETGTIKLMNVGENLAGERLKLVIERAAGQAGVDLADVQRVCLGLAGVSAPSTREWAETTLRTLTPGEIIVSGDEAIALDAAFGDGPGVLVIAGTGSHVVGRCTDNSHVSAGGWGPLLGDEGSGTWIGLEAIRAGLKAYDRGAKTTVLREIQLRWELSDLGELVGMANRKPRPDFAELTGVVATCAALGDQLAASVLRHAGEELALQVQLVLTKMAAAHPGDECLVDVAFTGSILARIPEVFNAFTDALRTELPDLHVRSQAVEPLEGALWRARHGAVVSPARLALAATEIRSNETAS
jgi:glucosamine kinase